MIKNLNKYSLLVLLTVLVTSQSCKKDFALVGGATNDQVFANAKGMMGVNVSIQRLYSQSVAYGLSSANGLLTGETFVVNTGNLSEVQLQNGGATVDNTNAQLALLWANANKCIYDANNVINNASIVPDKGYASGLVAYATLIKANALGCLSMLWENVPDTIGIGLSGANATFIPRTQGYSRCVAAIDRALAGITANPLSASFISDLPPGLNSGSDLIQALNALKARYALFAGNYSVALASANAVDLTRAVTFNFDAANPNQIFQSVTSTNNIYQPIDSTLGLPIGVRPSLNDGRVSFYTSINTAASPRFRLNGFWNAATRSIPVFVPDEMRLIRAECLLRQATPDAAGAQTILDGILKQVPTVDPFGLGANIAAGYTGASDVASLLTEVYRNRCIELFHSGMKLEDSRRFGRPVAERKRNNMPYPLAERNNNTNTPTDPVF